VLVTASLAAASMLSALPAHAQTAELGPAVAPEVSGPAAIDSAVSTVIDAAKVQLMLDVRRL